MISDKTINFYPGQGTGPCVVLIKGIYHSDHLFTFMLRHLQEYDCVTVNLHSYISGCDNSVDMLAQRVCADLDELQIQEAVLVAVGIGNAVALKMALSRPELTRGLIMVGMSNKAVDPALQSVQSDILDFANGRNFCPETRQLVSQTLFGCGERQAEIEQEIAESCSAENFASFRTLVTLQQQQHFTREELRSVKVPNMVVTATSDLWTSATDVQNLSETVGTNRGFIKVSNMTSNSLVLLSKQFVVILEVMVAEFSGSEHLSLQSS